MQYIFILKIFYFKNLDSSPLHAAAALSDLVLCALSATFKCDPLEGYKTVFYFTS